jgi:hypothetical protein
VSELADAMSVSMQRAWPVRGASGSQPGATGEHLTANARPPTIDIGWVRLSLLTEIQIAATEADESVAVLLRKCKILAAKLDHPGFAEWVEWELNGYPSDQPDLLPPYRKLRNLAVKGSFAGPAGSGMNNVPIPPACVDDAGNREALYSHNFVQGAAELENVLARSGDTDTLQSPWPGDALIAYGSRVYEFMTCISAWRVIPISAIAGTLDSVRNRVLSFALEIERENPDAGEAPVGSAPVSRDAVDRAYTINVLGGSNVIATEVGTVIQALDFDWQGLRAELAGYGLPDADLETLRLALAADRQSIQHGQIGPVTEGWIGKVTAKIETGALDLATNASGGVIAGAVLKALGVG